MPGRKIRYFILFLVIICIAKSQTLKFEQFTTKDGLLSDEVYNLHQDKKGYIWLFTHYGAMKYDGKEFRPVLTNLPFDESVIYSFYENEQGRKWAANSKKNIYEIINDSAFIVEGTQIMSEYFRKRAQEVYQLYVDDSLNIYAKTIMYTVKFPKDKGYKGSIINPSVNSKDYFEQVLKFKNTWMGVLNEYMDKLFLFKTNTIRFMDKSANGKTFNITSSGQGTVKYFKQFDETIYFTYLDRIVKIDPLHSHKEILLNELILNFTKDRNDHLWIASYRDGLLELDEKDSLIHQYFKGITVNDVLIDSENGLWVSTDGSGIYHCKNTGEYYYDNTQTLGKPVNFIKKIENNLFIATTAANLISIGQDKTVELEKNNHKYNDDPLDIELFDKGYLVSYRLHNEEVKKNHNAFTAETFPRIRPYFMPYKLLNVGVDSMLILSRNNMAILTMDMLDKGRLLNKFIVPAKTFDFKKRGKTVLIGTDKGVLCFQNDSLYQPSYLMGTGNSIVTKLKEDDAHNYWFCTKGDGLYKLTEKNELFHYTTANGLPGNIINDICFGADNSFLLSDNGGTYYHSKSYTDTSFTLFKKIFDGEVQSTVFFEGKIYLATKTGLVILNSNVLLKEPSLHFNLRSILVNSEEINEKKLDHLNYWDKTIEFKFDIISYSGKTYPLVYQLSGETSDTGRVMEDVLSFKNLSPGCYTLTTYPLIKEGGQAYKYVKTFTIVPAFWQTSWFFIVCCLAIAFLIAFIMWLFFRYYKNKELKKTETERMIAEYRLIALKAQINPHFMSNCIAAIQHLILQKKVDEANEYLAKFSFLVRQVLNLSNKSLVPLKEELEIADLYLKLEQLRFDKINVEFSVDPEIDTHVLLVPPLLLQPIVENAIWHGLLPLTKERAPVLSISLKIEKDVLKIIIEDNGVGRKSSDHHIGNSRESKGIAITKQRIENLKYLNDQGVSGLVYEDLVDEHGNPTGTRVIIFISGKLHL